MANTLPVDKLNRKAEIDYLKIYLMNRYELRSDESFVLNINAKWGYGKTYFLQSIKKELEKNHKVIYFDAWQNDFTKEPLLAFISVMSEELKEYFETKDKKANAFFKIAFKSSLPLIISILAKQATGCTLDELMEISEEEKTDETNKNSNISDIKTGISSLMSKATEIALQEHSDIKTSIDKFKIDMKNLLIKINDDKELPLFILIDELDRCRPNYAIELLESIKHLFDIPGIIFLIATDSKQLSHSINAVYGEKFASEKYLKRFFDQEYTLKEPDKYEYCKYLIEKEIQDTSMLFNPLQEKLYPEKNLDAVMITIFSEFFYLGPRDVKQCINMLFTIILTWDKEVKIHLPFLIFFIMLKHMSDEDFEVSINAMNDPFFTKLMNKKNIQVRCVFKGFNHNKAGSPNYKISLKEIILFYRELALMNNDKNKNNFFNQNRSVSEYENIMQECFPNNSYKLLKEYPKLVLNAGQFS